MVVSPVAARAADRPSLAWFPSLRPISQRGKGGVAVQSKVCHQPIYNQSMSKDFSEAVLFGKLTIIS
jgi:hypothetical protein